MAFLSTPAFGLGRRVGVNRCKVGKWRMSGLERETVRKEEDQSVDVEKLGRLSVEEKASGNGTPPPSELQLPAKSVGYAWPAFLVGGTAQILPIIGKTNFSDALYFFLVGASALYAGSKRNLTELPVDDLSPKQAFLAPIVSGVFLAGMYFLLRYTSIDVGQIFKYGSVVFGGICLKETLDPIFFNLYTKVFPLQPVTKAVGEDGCEEDVEPWNSPKNVTTALISAAISGSYLLGSGAITFMASNLIGFGLAVRCISLLKPKSLWSAAALLSGLLLYDVFFVFGTDVMVSVATSIEAPAKFLFPRETVPGATGVQSYPFAILGLGDVVVPGIFVAMMAFVDKELVFEDDREVCQVRNGPYFSSSMVAYVAGLFTCFVVNAVSHSPQPALLYLVPFLLGNALAVSAFRGELMKIIKFERQSQESIVNRMKKEEAE